jgi:hypothetical protein
MGILLCEGAVKTDLMAAREFAARYDRRQLDDRLLIKPGAHRGVGVKARFNLFAGVQAGIELTGAMSWAPPRELAALRSAL